MYVYNIKQNKGIKSTLFKLTNIHQRRGVLRTPSNIQEGDCDGFQCLTIFKKNSSQKFDRVRNVCYKLVVKKFSIYNLKQS